MTDSSIVFFWCAAGFATGVILFATVIAISWYLIGKDCDDAWQQEKERQQRQRYKPPPPPPPPKK